MYSNEQNNNNQPAFIATEAWQVNQYSLQIFKELYPGMDSRRSKLPLLLTHSLCRWNV